MIAYSYNFTMCLLSGLDAVRQICHQQVISKCVVGLEALADRDLRSLVSKHRVLVDHRRALHRELLQHEQPPALSETVVAAIGSAVGASLAELLKQTPVAQLGVVADFARPDLDQ